MSTLINGPMVPRFLTPDMPSQETTDAYTAPHHRYGDNSRWERQQPTRPEHSWNRPRPSRPDHSWNRPQPSRPDHAWNDRQPMRPDHAWSDRQPMRPDHAWSDRRPMRPDHAWSHRQPTRHEQSWERPRPSRPDYQTCEHNQPRPTPRNHPHPDQSGPYEQRDVVARHEAPWSDFADEAVDA